MRENASLVVSAMKELDMEFVPFVDDIVSGNARGACVPACVAPAVSLTLCAFAQTS